MKRREFAQSIALTGMASGFGWTSHKKESAFSLHYAPHLGMFKITCWEDPMAQLEFMADQGFTAFEDNGMKARDVELQKDMSALMKERNLKMGVFVAHQIYWSEGNLASGDSEKRSAFLKDIESSIEVAKRVNATWMTVVPGTHDLKKDLGYQTANVVQALKEASALLEPEGLVMVLEPLNFRDHPNMFLAESAQAYQICKAVNSPSCKILFDIYHQQIQEGNLIPNIEACWDEIAYFQIGDNPGRKEPGTGEINYANVFKYIRERSYSGILGMEHGNFSSGKEGEQALIDAYKKADAQL